MVKRMLIDATHEEEIRVAVIDGKILEELDVESASKRLLKGSIYLAKVTRVEPSLQAAFVDYGGNRHGFLPFNEIHPDYYQIPVADREALLAEQAALAEDDEEVREEEGGESPPPEEALSAAAEDEDPEEGENDGGEADEDAPNGAPAGEDGVETVGGDDEDEVDQRKRVRLTRRYKIQEVIQRRQILLVQVAKEERGTKGAALTSYISLAGRYCVLMPNTFRGGGISRRITSYADRKRLRSILGDLDVQQGMSVILRTAGLQRSKAEIKRDFDYLLRTWNSVRETTLSSIAPALIHEEANLIKRSIRDLYARDIGEVLVEGEDGYREAKNFMKMLMPSHSRRVQQYKDGTIPLFFRYQVESQLDSLHSPTVRLKSGSYVVMNPTEALVAIDVNSGRATRERNIEETALKTNIEAADEIARQLRLRDLAGLIVIDFIDMEHRRNVHAVERRLKEALRADRARIQVGRISPFGLLEMSRQRLRPGLHETAFDACAQCGGAGIVRSIESTAIHVLRGIEEEGIRRRASEIAVYVPSSVALYVLNQKRDRLAEVESRYALRVTVAVDRELVPPDYRLERIKAAVGEAPPEVAAALVEAEAEAEAEAEVEVEGALDEQAAGEAGAKRKRRRRRRKRRPDETRAEAAEGAEAEDDRSDAAEEAEDEGEPAEALADDGEESAPRRGRRRGRRGSRRRGRGAADAAPATEEAEADEAAPAPETAGEDADEASAAKPAPAPEAASKDADEASAAKPARTRRSPRRAKVKTAEKTAPGDGGEPASAPSHPATAIAAAEDTGKPDNGEGERGEAAGERAKEAPAESQPNEDQLPSRRQGWWQKLIS